MLTYERKPLKLSDPKFDKIVCQITKSYPKSCVLWIDEIENDMLFARYCQKKEQLSKMYSEIEELQMFHGTKMHCIDSICEQGFKSELNVSSAYGKGTYFATDAAISRGYMQSDSDIIYMFLADIVIGKKYCYITSQKNKNLTIGECYVNMIPKSTIFVVPEDDSIYPRYIIAFHKNPSM
jgi:poly [ADP-ribose] polymerase 7/11/12/13